MYVNARWIRRSLAGDVRHLKKWVRDMASSVGAYTVIQILRPCQRPPPQSGDDTSELFSDAETKKEGLWVAYLATNDEYSLINLIDSVRELYSGANIIEVRQSDISKGNSYNASETVPLTLYGVIENEDDPQYYKVIELSNMNPYTTEQRGVKSRVAPCTNPKSKQKQNDNNASPTSNSSSGSGCGRGRGATARRSIMARDSEEVNNLADYAMMNLSMGISVTVKVGGEESKKTLGQWLADTEAYIRDNCQNFMDVRNLFDFFSTQPEESVETATDYSLTSATPDRVSMPLGDTNIMIAGAKLSNDPNKPLDAIYPTYIIREIPQFTLTGQQIYSYMIAKLDEDLRANLLSRTRFGLMTYKDDIYYMQSQISLSEIPSTEKLINANNIETALSNTIFDLDGNKAVDKAHFYRLHSTAISTNINKRNTHGIPPLMHPCMYDVKCYDMNDADTEGNITIDLTKNSPVGYDVGYSNTPYTTASIIAKFTRDDGNIESAGGTVLYYLRPIHISKVSDKYNEFAGNYYSYALTPQPEGERGYTVPIQIYQCYAPKEDSPIELRLPVLHNDDQYIKDIIGNIKEVVKSTPTIVTDYGVQILDPSGLGINEGLGYIWNTSENMTSLDGWHDGERDIKIKLENDNEFIVHYGLTFGITGSVFGLPGSSGDISIDFLTNIDTYSKFNNALDTYNNGNGKFFMFTMSPYIQDHGNPDVIMVLVIDSELGTITANMYLCDDIDAYYNNTANPPSVKEPLLDDPYFDYPLNAIGNPFPLTTQIISDIRSGNITSKRAIQFTTTDASNASSKGIAFYRYLNNMILNWRSAVDDSGWNDDGVTKLSTNLINTRWYAGQYKTTTSRSVRYNRRARTNPGLVVL